MNFKRYVTGAGNQPILQEWTWTGRDSNPHDFARYGRMDFHLDSYLSPDFRKLRLRPGGMLIVPPALSWTSLKPSVYQFRHPSKSGEDVTPPLNTQNLIPCVLLKGVDDPRTNGGGMELRVIKHDTDADYRITSLASGSSSRCLTTTPETT